jgi:hypothetical protein
VEEALLETLANLNHIKKFQRGKSREQFQPSELLHSLSDTILDFGF